MLSNVIPAEKRIEDLTKEELRFEVAKALGHEVEMRWCAHDPECGGFSETESLYSADSNDGFTLERLEHEKQKSPDNTYTYLRQLPCIKTITRWSDSDDAGITYDIVPDYPNDIAAAWSLIDEMPLRTWIVQSYQDFWRVMSYDRNKIVACGTQPTLPGWAYSDGPTPQMAICLTYLKLVQHG